MARRVNSQSLAVLLLGFNVMHRILRRYASTASVPTFVPPASLHAIKRTILPRGTPQPTSPTFYTARADYFDTVIRLEHAMKAAKASLQDRHLLPLPKFAKESLAPAAPIWRNQKEMADLFGVGLTNTKFVLYHD